MTGIALLCASAIVMAAAFTAKAAMRRRSAAERHAVWVAAFVALWLIPLGGLLPPGSTAAPVFLINLASASGAYAVSPVTFDWLTTIWLSGVVVCFGRIVVAARTAFLLIRSTRPAGALGRYKVRYSKDLSGPAAWGIGHKLMLLPESAATWDEERRSAVVNHEAAHLRRNDCWALLISEIACAVYWCNPLVWLAASQLRLEQEYAADDDVLNHGADPATYAGHLIALAKAGRPPILAAGAISQSQLTARVEAILDSRRLRHMPTHTTLGALAVFALAVAMPLASMQAERKVEKPGPEVTAPRVIEKVEPNYTDEAREAKIEGSVNLHVVIEADGRIYEANVSKELDPGLDAKAIEAVRAWRFAPAMKAGEPVAVGATIEVNFRLL